MVEAGGVAAEVAVLEEEAEDPGVAERGAKGNK